jgi:hypothetical protein
MIKNQAAKLVLHHKLKLKKRWQRQLKEKPPIADPNAKKLKS